MTDTDIVTRLRDYYTSDADNFVIEHRICDEAADELERLAVRLVEMGKVAIDRGNQLIAANAEIERLRAALAERAEECAKVCDAEASGPPTAGFVYADGFIDGASKCGDAIRAKFKA